MRPHTNACRTTSEFTEIIMCLFSSSSIAEMSGNMLLLFMLLSFRLMLFWMTPSIFISSSSEQLFNATGAFKSSTSAGVKKGESSRFKDISFSFCPA